MRLGSRELPRRQLNGKAAGNLSSRNAAIATAVTARIPAMPASRPLNGFVGSANSRRGTRVWSGGYEQLVEIRQRRFVVVHPRALRDGSLERRYLVLRSFGRS